MATNQAVHDSPTTGPTLNRFRACMLCGTTKARENSSLCTACADEVDRMEMLDNPIANEPTCPVDGFVLNRLGTCDECDRAWKPVAR